MHQHHKNPCMHQKAPQKTPLVTLPNSKLNQAELTAFCGTLGRNQGVARGQIRKCGENRGNADQTPVLLFRDLRFLFLNIVLCSKVFNFSPHFHNFISQTVCFPGIASQSHQTGSPIPGSAGLAISLATAAALVAAGLYARHKKSRR